MTERSESSDAAAAVYLLMFSFVLSAFETRRMKTEPPSSCTCGSYSLHVPELFLIYFVPVKKTEKTSEGKEQTEAFELAV